MSDITQFFLNTAKYIAVDEQGNKFDLEVNYWKNTFSVAPYNQQLEAYAKKLLNKKHQVNFIYKMHEEESSDTTSQ